MREIFKPFWVTGVLMICFVWGFLFGVNDIHSLFAYILSGSVIGVIGGMIYERFENQDRI